MGRRNHVTIRLAFGLLILVWFNVWYGTALAEPPIGNKAGFARNYVGEQCWYDQILKEESGYFTADMIELHTVMTFRDPVCMEDNEQVKFQINNVLSNWYSLPDAAFQTDSEDTLRPALFQRRGRCIQSRTYRERGIMVDYIARRGHIVQVIHEGAINGCAR